MSDEIDSRLRAAREHLPAPTESETLAARERVVAALAAQPAHARPGRRSLRRRALVLVPALLACLAAAFGVGYAVASAGRGGSTPAPATRTGEKPRLNAGPGFLPAAGWDVAATGTTAPPQAPTAVAANVPLRAADRARPGPPRETAGALGANGVVFYATFYPAAAGEKLTQRLLPLRLDDARTIPGFEGMPPVGQTRRLQARVGLYDVDVLVFFGAAHPSPAVLAAAREELGRLVVPACPDARPLTAGDLPAAKAYVLRWLRGHYPDDPAQLAGARATAALGAAAPRSGAAVEACGATVGARTVEVDVVLPKLERISASLSQLSFFVARTPGGWTVWQRIH
jgi:hypothetical protein